MTPIELTYEGGPNNAEALLVDPRDGAIVVVTKKDNGKSDIFTAAPPFVVGTKATLRKVGTIEIGLPPYVGSKLVTGASITRSGDLLMLRTYTSAYAWTRRPGESIASAFAGTRCSLPARTEAQSEAIAASPDGSGFYTISEGASPPLTFVPRL